MKNEVSKRDFRSQFSILIDNRIECGCHKKQGGSIAMPYPALIKHENKSYNGMNILYFSVEKRKK